MAENEDGIGLNNDDDKSRQINLSLMTLLILSSLFLIYTILSAHYMYMFKITQGLCLLWLGLSLLYFDKKKNLNERDIILSCLPLLIMAPLLFLFLASESLMIEYHIVLSLFSIFFFFSFNLKQKSTILLYSLFAVEYILVSLLHPLFSCSEFMRSGGILLHLIILSLGAAFRERYHYQEDLFLCRNRINQLKKSNSGCTEGDPLLGIFSKTGGMKVLKQTMKWSERYDIPLTVCYMELNSSHNDYIHTVTRGIFKRIRESDTLFRLGNSEMILILPDCDKQDAASVMKHISGTLISQNTLKFMQYGLADFKAEMTNSPNELIINANLASETA